MNNTAILDSDAPIASTVRRVFIVDDHPLFRQGLSRFVESEPNLKVCGEAHSAPQALEALRTIQADVVLVDIALPGANGLELIKQLRAEHPKLPILVISAHDEQLYALRALRAGAAGYLMKREADTTCATALRKVLEGGVYVSPALGEQLIYKVARNDQEVGSSPLSVLTDREMEVLQMIGEGKASRQIAEELHLSVKTIESHRLHIKEKLNLKSSTDLVRFALEFVAQQTA